jgi:hypothetical protein
MKIVPILTSCLIISVAYNVYQFTKTTPPEPIICPTLPGYGEVRRISKDEANGFINQYRMSSDNPELVLGGIITRTAFDDLLCTKSCNAIAYSFAIDSLGQVGPENRGTFPIFTAVNVEYDDSNNTIKRVNDLNIERSVPHNWCPTACIQ